MLEKISLNLDNLCLAYPRLLAVAIQVVAKSFLYRLYDFYRLQIHSLNALLYNELKLHNQPIHHKFSNNQNK